MTLQFTYFLYGSGPKEIRSVQHPVAKAVLYDGLAPVADKEILDFLQSVAPAVLAGHGCLILFPQAPVVVQSLQDDGSEDLDGVQIRELHSSSSIGKASMAKRNPSNST